MICLSATSVSKNQVLKLLHLNVYLCLRLAAKVQMLQYKKIVDCRVSNQSDCRPETVDNAEKERRSMLGD